MLSLPRAQGCDIQLSRLTSNKRNEDLHLIEKGSMQSSIKNKSASTSSTRVRDNQYVIELERKLQQHELSRVLPTADTCGAATCESRVKRLVDENRKLRELLGQAGFTSAYIETHLQVAAPSWDGADTLPSSLGALTSELVSGDICSTQSLGPSPSFHNLLSTIFPDLNEDTTILDSTPFSPNSPARPVQTAAGDCSAESHESLVFSSLSPDNSDGIVTWPFTQARIVPDVILAGGETGNTCDTTLCTKAYKMVHQYNQKNVDMIEIGIRLWNGFIKGDRGGGCKVENSVLFSVLHHISSGEFSVAGNSV